MAQMTVNPVGLFRHNDFVVLFLDTPLGNELFEQAAATDREFFAFIIGKVLADSEGNLYRLNHDDDGNLATGIIFADIHKTTIPLDMPNHKIVGMKPEHAHPDVPEFKSNL